MEKTNETVNEDDILLCSKCHKKPRFYEVTGLWYIQCLGKCERLEVGVTPKRVIKNWNELNKKSIKYIPKTKQFRKPNEYDGVGNGEPIYQIAKTGRTVKIFKSCRHLANCLGLSKNTVVGKFCATKTGYVTISGKTYFREPKNANDTNNTETTPKTARRGRPRKVQD